YDRIGLVVPDRRSNGHRRYGVATVQVLQVIQLARAVGCTLDEIRALVVPGVPERRRALARDKVRELRRRQHQLALAEAVLSHLAECRHSAQESADCQRAVLDSLAVLGDGVRAPGSRLPGTD
ncbi:MAG: MerR family transcriptional regulator, partial [Nocardioides sp.]